MRSYLKEILIHGKKKIIYEDNIWKSDNMLNLW